MFQDQIHKRVLSLLLSLALVLGLFGVDVVGISAAGGDSPTLLYLDSGDIVIDGASVTQNSQPVQRGAQDSGYRITQKDSGTATAHTVTVKSGTQDITIQNTNINASGAPLSIAAGASVNLTLLGGNTLKCGGGTASIWVSEHAALTIMAGSTGSLDVTGGWGQWSGGSYGIGGDPCGSITINGGTIRATPGGENSGIGGPNAEITINGGSVTATGYDVSPGIGGNFTQAAKSITINGGTVLAQCMDGSGGFFGEAAGIGGGWRSAAGTIKITGGKVTAQGGSDGGAGIGGSSGNGGTIEISGGTVNASGGSNGGGAGIGGLGGSDGGTISISGGNVTATGTSSGAGIGGNWGDVHAGTITISGGTVTATGSDGAAGIGGDEGYGYDDDLQSYTGLGGKVTITGSGTVVTATGGDSSAYDIGSGTNTGTTGVGGDLTVTGDSEDLDSLPVLILGKGGTNAQYKFTDCVVLGAGAAVLAGWYDGNRTRTPVFDVTYGSVSVGESQATGYIGSQSQITEYNTGLLLVTGTSSSGQISVTGGKHKIIAYNLNISGGCAFTADGDSNVNLARYGNSALTSTGSHAGLEIAMGATLKISGTGSLTAKGGNGAAGIGGGYEGSGGSVTIDGGTVTATGNSGGAGIGGGIGSNCGTVNISGGTVTATGGGYRDGGGAGIGGGGADYVETGDGWNYQGGKGGSITISGGTVTAAGCDGGAGIGGGSSGGGSGGDGGTVTITGKATMAIATGSDGSFDIGPGAGSTNGGSLSVGDPQDGTSPLPTLLLMKNGTNTFTTFRNCTISGAGAGDLAGTYNADGARVNFNFTVTFDKNGGDTAAVPATAEAAFGGTVPMPAAEPTRAGYTFSGWNTRPDGLGDAFGASTKVTNDRTVYAQWTANAPVGTAPVISPDMVTYNLSSPGDASAAVIFNRAESVTGVKRGSVFLTENTDYTVNGSSLTILNRYLSGQGFAAGDSEDFTVSFDTGDQVTLTINVISGSISSQPHTLTVKLGAGGSITSACAAGSGISVSAASERGYQFSNWTSSGGGTFKDRNSASTMFTMPDQDVIVTAEFKNTPGGGGSSHSSSTAVTPTMPTSLTDTPTNTTVDLSDATFPASVTSIMLAVTPETASGTPVGTAGGVADPQGAAVCRFVVSDPALNVIGMPILYDIRLLDQRGNPIPSFTGSVKVRIPLPAGIHGTTRVYRYEPDGSLTDLSATVQSGYLVFQTNHFSYYVIAGTGDSVTLDTKSYQMPVGGKYQIGLKLTGSKAASVKITSTNDKAAAAVRLKNGNVLVTGRGVGTAYVMIDVYDSKKYLLTHASVKMDVKAGIRPRGDSTRQIGVF